MIPQHAVLLAGGTGSRLRPLNSTGTPKALLPVGNEPLISFPLRSIEEAGIKTVFVICFGDSSAAKVQSWLASSYHGKLTVVVKSIPDDSSGHKTAGALRAVANKLAGDDILVMSGDVVTTVSLKGLLLLQLQNSATCTSLLTQRSVSSSTENKPGRAPTNVDYVGICEKTKQLLFFESSTEQAKRSLKVSMPTLEHSGSVLLQTGLVDQHCYVFKRAIVLDVLESKPAIQSIKEDLVPYLVRHQREQQRSGRPDGDSEPSDLTADKTEANGHITPRPGIERTEWWAGAFIAPETQYCKRANTLAAYGDVNRDVSSSPELAAKFLSQRLNSEGYFRHESVAVAAKTMVGPGCMLGSGTRVGEKSTLKRSVVGSRCSIGSHVKLLNSVVLDDVIIEDNCAMQNCILCSGSHVQANVQLRDCQLGPATSVASGSEYRGEIFDKNKQLGGQ